MKPFVEAVAHLVPTHKIRKIRGYRAKRGFAVDTHGNAVIRRGMYDISIMLVKTKRERLADGSYVYNKTKDEYIFEILHTLAHELSHIHPKGWDHTLFHVALETKIMAIFIKIMKKHKVQVEDYYKFSWKKLMKAHDELSKENKDG